MKTLVTIIGISLCSYLFAQPSLDWAGTIHTGSLGDDEYAVAIETNNNNDVFIFGRVNTATNDFMLGPGTFNDPSVLGYQFFVAKYNQFSSLQWVQIFGEGASYALPVDMDIDGQGNIYLTGEFQGTMDIDPSPSTFNITGSPSSNTAFYMKLTASGSLDWGHSLDGKTYVKSIYVADNGFFYSTGSFAGSVDLDPGPGTISYSTTPSNLDDAFITKWDLNGNVIWGKVFSGSDDVEGKAISCDSDDNVYISGSFKNTADFDPDAGTSNLFSSGSFDGFVAKLDELGQLVWARSYGGTFIDMPYEAVVDTDKNTYIVGYFNGTTDFDPGPGVFSLTAQNIDSYILKLDSLGNFSWVKQFGSTLQDISRTVDVDNNGNVFFGGKYKDSLDADPGTGLEMIYSNDITGDEDIFMIQLDPNGNYQWAQSIGGNGEDRLMRIHVSNERVYTTGMITNNTDLDPGPGTVTASCIGGIDVFAQQFSYCSNSYSSIDTTVCVSYTSPSGNDTWSASGTYIDTLSNINGCDSILQIDLTIADIFAPTADVGILPDITTICGQPITSLTAPTATDNCLGSVSGTHNATLPITTFGTTVVTWTYDDGNGNTSIQTQNVIINADVTAPVADQASLTTIITNCGQPVTSLAAPTATDNCAGTITGTHNATLPITSSTTVTWTYDDGNGNTSTQSQTVTINVDNTAPVADIATLSNVTSECSITSLMAPTATDNCSGTITGTHNATLPITTQGTTTLTWTYDDGNGNTSTQTQDVVINDVTAPVADVASLSNLTDECSVTSLTAPTATDNCVGTITGTHNAMLPITTQGTTTVTWTYDDGNGNTSTQTQDVVINDVTLPVADQASLTAIITNCGQPVTSLTAPTASDNCAGTITGTHNATLPITSSTTVTWTYDDGNGNTSTQSQTVTINVDSTAPVADVPTLSSVTAECEVTSLTAPTATDDCAGTVTGTHNATLPITTQGTTTITWTYDDGNGNTSTQTQEVVISDGTAPVADAANLADTNAECDVTPTAPSATDNCAGTITATPDVSFPITASGTTTITWTYDDGNGNTSTQTQEVIITPIDNGVTIVDDITLSADASGYTYQWVDCEDNNAPIAGETNQTFEATSNGSYAVIIDNGDCSVTSACFDITTVGLDKNEMQTINVFPNPTSGTVTINSSAQFNTVEVVNVMGQVVYSTTLNEVNTHKVELPEAKGVYFIKVSGNTTNDTFRIIKK